MKIKIEMTVELDEHEYGACYGVYDVDAAYRKDIRDEVRGDAIQAVNQTFENIGCHSGRVTKFNA